VRMGFVGPICLLFSRLAFILLEEVDISHVSRRFTW
jgi:hypothetical protein